MDGEGTMQGRDLAGAWTALVTPFSRDGAGSAPPIDLGRLAANIDHQSIAGITGVVPCGTTGETPTLTAAEYESVVVRTVEAARAHGLRVIAGAGGNDTRRAIDRHRFVADAGADAALHVTPYYNKPSQAGMHRHFSAIADACELPVVLYNVPGRTGVGLAIETIERLAAHPNIVAVKEASGDLGLAADIAARTGLTLLSGDDPLTMPMAVNGGRGVISVVANLLPDRVAAMVAAFLRTDWKEAIRRHHELLPIARAVLSLDANPVPIKAAMRLAGRDSGAVRSPLVEASEAVIARLRELLAPLEISRRDETAAAVEVTRIPTARGAKYGA